MNRRDIVEDENRDSKSYIEINEPITDVPDTTIVKIGTEELMVVTSVLVLVLILTMICVTIGIAVS